MFQLLLIKAAGILPQIPNLDNNGPQDVLYNPNPNPNPDYLQAALQAGGMCFMFDESVIATDSIHLLGVIVYLMGCPLRSIKAGSCLANQR